MVRSGELTYICRQNCPTCALTCTDWWLLSVDGFQSCGRCETGVQSRGLLRPAALHQAAVILLNLQLTRVVFWTAGPVDGFDPDVLTPLDMAVLL